jgi:hypothetical protein
MRWNTSPGAMPALVAGIHIFPLPILPRVRGRIGRGSKQGVDGRDKPGHDSEKWF